MPERRKKLIRAGDLGIDLGAGTEKALFRWLLACLLFGKPIQQEIARNAFLEFDHAGLDSPEAVLAAGWDRLVELLDRARYVRYDFSTARKILDICSELQKGDGSLKQMIAGCPTPVVLGRRLQEFKGIGPVTARIFLRDVRPVWSLLKRSGSASDA
jgi:endonuclease III